MEYPAKRFFNPNFFSIKDTLGDLKKNPKSGAILGKMMEKMTLEQ